MRFLIGIVISVIFIFLALRGINLKVVWSTIVSIDIFYLPLFIFLTIVSLFIRTTRWRTMFEPNYRRQFKLFFQATCVGLMTNNILPFRIGDLAQAYFLGYTGNLSKAMVLSTVFIERIIDFIMVVLIILLGSFFILIPKDVPLNTLLLLFILVILVIVVILRSQKSLYDITNKLPVSEKMKRGINTLIKNFYEGFNVLKEGRKTILILLFSILLWLSYVMGTFICLRAFKINLSIFAATLVLSITAISVMVPSSPGYIGTWEFFCIIGLSIFGVDKPKALGFAIFHHFISTIVIVVLGVIILIKTGISLKMLMKK